MNDSYHDGYITNYIMTPGTFEEYKKFLVNVSKLTKDLETAKPYITKAIEIAEKAQPYRYEGPNMTDLLQLIKCQLDDLAKYTDVKLED
jgi:hypothetical protein